MKIKIETKTLSNYWRRYEDITQDAITSKKKAGCEVLVLAPISNEPYGTREQPQTGEFLNTAF
jgi:hypothetical protein